MVFVVADYYTSRPKLSWAWVRGILNVTPSGKALPCHAAESIPDLVFDNVRDRRLARHLIDPRGLSEISRHRLDARTLPLLRIPRGRRGRLPLPGTALHRRACRPSLY
jgi:hypothetical protein